MNIYQEFVRTSGAFASKLNTEGAFSFLDRRDLNAIKPTPEEYAEKKNRMINNLFHSEAWLKDATIYEIDDKIKKICAFSSVPKNSDKYAFLPHPHMFINVDFTDEEFDMKDRRIFGILLGESPLLTESSEFILNLKNKGLFNEYSRDELMNDPVFKVGKCINALLFAESQTGAVFLDSVTFAYKFDEKSDLDKMDVKTDKISTTDFVRKFVLNFLNFLNDPDVIEVERPRSEKNVERRIREGKMPLPNSVIVRITGRLLHYVNSKSSKAGWHYSFRFPVRKHKRRYRDEQGNVEKTIIVDRFFKGQGVLIDRKYKVIADEEQSRVKEWNEENFDMNDVKPLKKPLRKLRDKGNIHRMKIE